MKDAHESPYPFIFNKIYCLSIIQRLASVHLIIIEPRQNDLLKTQKVNKNYKSKSSEYTTLKYEVSDCPWLINAIIFSEMLFIDWYIYRMIKNNEDDP